MEKKHEKIKVGIDSHIYTKLWELWEDQVRCGASNRRASTNDMINYVLGSIVDGWERSGSWEREWVERLGLMPKGYSLDADTLDGQQTHGKLEPKKPLEFQVESKKYNKTVSFIRPGHGSIYVDLLGENKRIGEEGIFTQEVVDMAVYGGDDQEAFEKICKAWWTAWLRNNRKWDSMTDEEKYNG